MITLESYKMGAHRQLSDWAQAIRKKATHVSEGTITKVKGVIAAVSFVSLVKTTYDYLHYGEVSYVATVAPIIAAIAMKTGLDYIQAVKKPDLSRTQAEILSDSWGKITLKVNGLIKHFKDVIILPANDQQIAEEWNWKWDKESAMRHHPGIRIKDVQHLILSKTPKPDVVILSQGRGYGRERENAGPGILEVEAGVKEFIKSQGVSEVYILKTAAAVAKYNEIRNRGGKRIAALIHTTC